MLDEDTSKYMVTTRSSVGGWGRTYFDALDRKVRTVSHSETINKAKKKVKVNVFTDFVYNNKGEVVASTIPYFEGMMAGIDSQWIKVKYDVLGRTIEQSQPSPRGAMVTSMSYDGLTVTTKSPKGYSKTVEKNALDQTLRVEENDGSEVAFAYDALGNLVETMTNGAVSSTIKYDEFSRKIEMKDRTLGTWKYDYNAFGELVSQKDARGQVSRISYDKLGRIKTKTEGGRTTSFKYDTAKNGKGKIASSNNGLVKKSYEYDHLGRVTTSKQSIDNQNFETNYEYNNASQVSQVAYPSGMRMKYEYDINGLAKSVGIPQQDIWTETFINLEEDLIKIARYIEELEKQANRAASRVRYYQRKSAYYSRLMRHYSYHGKRYDRAVKSLERQRRAIAKRFNKYASKARAYRRKANYFNRHFRNIVFSYVRSSGGYNYYRYQKCVRKNWKGHCKSYRNYNFTVEKEVSSKTFRWKGSSYTWSRPLKRVNLSKQYSKWAAIYERKSRAVERRRSSDLRRNAYYLNRYKRSRAWYQARAKWARKYAKVYAKLAAKEARELRKINKKLKSQRSAFNTTQAQVNAMELDDSIYTIWAATNRDAQNRLQGEWYGNGYMTTRYYNSDGTIDQIKTGVAKTLIRDIRYKYDSRANITSKTDNINGTREYYAYDDMDRIKSWNYRRTANSKKKRTAKKYRRTYRYDIDGNMVYKSGMGTMSYNAKNQLKRIGKDKDYSYDPNGNMERGNDKSYKYNSFNKVSRLNYNGGYQTFAYDESNELVKKVINNKSTIYYVGTAYELELKKTSAGTDHIMRHNVMIEGKAVAVHTRTIKADKRKADKTAYIHKDLLGSVDTVTDNKKAIVYRNEFTPYGENISNLEGNKKFDKRDLRGYTGHRQISEANVINMNARLYDPQIGRFTSADTMIPDALTPMAYNRYMYVYGNPIKYEDPSGHFVVSAFVAGLAIFTVGATSDDAFIQKAGMLVGSMLMMGAGGASFSLQAVTIEHGAMVGFTTNFISSGGDLGEGVQGAITSAISASLSQGVAGEFGHGWSMEGAVAHGVSQGFVSKLRGQSGRSGFISGFLGKVSGSLSHNYFGGKTTADTIGSTSITTVFGGMASQATGGDFYEGAMRAAFVHLFNDLKMMTLKKFLEGTSHPATNVALSSGSQNTLKKTNIDPRGANIFGDMIATGVTGAAGGAFVAGPPGAFIGGVFGTAGGFVIGTGLEYSGFNHVQETSANYLLNYDYTETFEEMMINLTRY